MSLILDALRKSEHSRQQSLTGRLGTTEVPPAPGRAAVPWVAIIGLLLLVNAAALVVLFWRGAAPPAVTAAPTATPAPAPVSQHPAVRPLAAEAPAAASPAPALVPTLTALPQAASTAAAAPAEVPNLDSLPADFQHSLPALHLDVHAYVDKPAERFVIINLQRYRIGDTLAEGPRVVDILPQGVVLEYRGTTFLLPRA
jgi:general secretion pathway protein B